MLSYDMLRVYNECYTQEWIGLLRKRTLFAAIIPVWKNISGFRLVNCLQARGGLAASEVATYNSITGGKHSGLTPANDRDVL